MKILELFAGSCSFSNVAKEFGYETFTTDIQQNPYNTVYYVVDIMGFQVHLVQHIVLQVAQHIGHHHLIDNLRQRKLEIMNYLYGKL